MSDGVARVCFYCADQNPHRDRSIGITNYTFGLLDGLKQNGSMQLHAVASRSSSGVPDGIPITTLPFRTDRALGRLIADHFHPLILGQRVDADIWHYPKGFLPMGAQVRQPKIGTIADTILQFYADNYPHARSGAGYAYWIAMLKNAVRKLDAIITVSEFSKRAILQFADRYRIQAPPILVTYQGVNISSAVMSDRSSRNYVLHLASKAPHKKTNWLLEQWRRMQNSGRSLPPLRLIGQLDARGRRLLDQVQHARLDGPLSRDEILAAMSNALALVLPSEVEGFGLPAFEAYYCGCPVAYVRDTAVAEILGSDTPGGFCLEDESVDLALSDLLQMSDAAIQSKSNELRERFSWPQCVARTIAAYQTVAVAK